MCRRGRGRAEAGAERRGQRGEAERREQKAKTEKRKTKEQRSETQKSEKLKLRAMQRDSNERHLQKAAMLLRSLQVFSVFLVFCFRFSVLASLLSLLCCFVLCADAGLVVVVGIGAFGLLFGGGGFRGGSGFGDLV